jgi:hypothetical protein
MTSSSKPVDEIEIEKLLEDRRDRFGDSSA